MIFQPQPSIFSETPLQMSFTLSQVFECLAKEETAINFLIIPPDQQEFLDNIPEWAPVIVETEKRTQEATTAIKPHAQVSQAQEILRKKQSRIAELDAWFQSNRVLFHRHSSLTNITEIYPTPQKSTSIEEFVPRLCKDLAHRRCRSMPNISTVFEPNFKSKSPITEKNRSSTSKSSNISGGRKKILKNSWLLRRDMLKAKLVHPKSPTDRRLLRNAVRNSVQSLKKKSPRKILAAVQQSPSKLSVVVRQSPRKKLSLAVRQSPRKLPSTVQQSPRKLPSTVQQSPRKLPSVKQQSLHKEPGHHTRPSLQKVNSKASPKKVNPSIIPSLISQSPKKGKILALKKKVLEERLQVFPNVQETVLNPPGTHKMHLRSMPTKTLNSKSLQNHEISIVGIQTIPQPRCAFTKSQVSSSVPDVTIKQERTSPQTSNNCSEASLSQSLMSDHTIGQTYVVRSNNIPVTPINANLSGYTMGNDTQQACLLIGTTNFTSQSSKSTKCPSVSPFSSSSSESTPSTIPKIISQLESPNQRRANFKTPSDLRQNHLSARKRLCLDVEPPRNDVGTSTEQQRTVNFIDTTTQILNGEADFKFTAVQVRGMARAIFSMYK